MVCPASLWSREKGEKMAWQSRKSNKYVSKKVIADGITFDSKKEAHRYQELLLLERTGKIKNLQRQVKYTLIPAQYEKVWKPRKKAYEKGKCLERECSYIADFVYIDIKTGEIVVEDTKGFKTKDYIIKRKLMLYTHDIKIKEI